MERISRESFAFLEAYYYFDAMQMFPNPGQWLDQPVRLLKAFRIIVAERRRVEEEEKEDK